ncbi:MAG: solute:sodium symporter family transporter, partial [Planctomycetes bacterium]|nr:solute:sodium symporter family transporter [Planctomycetota bacterium]
MDLNWIDLSAFIVFMTAVMAISIYASRKEAGSEDYFLAGRKLTWWLIGFSLIASNISTEHFVGMAGKGFGRVGLAIASYEWMSAITLVIVAWFLLPRFLKAGIYTMPEFLEYRYNAAARGIMAVFIMIAYVVVALATVLFSGAIALEAIFGMDRTLGVWLIGIIAGSYTIYGGLKAVVWSDLLQGGALLAGGALVAVLGLLALGNGDGFLAGMKSFAETNADKLHVVLPWNDPDVPWLAVFIGGLWIPNLFYWGLNQFITQRTLGAKSLAEGQKGILLAALLKLTIPFIIVIPGIMAFQLYGDRITDGDGAYPHMIKELLPPQLRGIMFAALCGAVMSSFNSMLNSASTIFTIDIYQRHINRQASQKRLVHVGRIATTAFVIIGCLWAPQIDKVVDHVFDYIQKFWGFITPGIVAAFLVGLVLKKAPPLAAICALVLNIPVYGLLLCFLPGWAFLHLMGVTFVILAAVMILITWFKPMDKPVIMPVSKIDT